MWNIFKRKEKPVEETKEVKLDSNEEYSNYTVITEDDAKKLNLYYEHLCDYARNAQMVVYYMIDDNIRVNLFERDNVLQSDEYEITIDYELFRKYARDLPTERLINFKKTLSNFQGNI